MARAATKNRHGAGIGSHVCIRLTPLYALARFARSASPRSCGAAPLPARALPLTRQGALPPGPHARIRSLVGCFALSFSYFYFFFINKEQMQIMCYVLSPLSAPQEKFMLIAIEQARIAADEGEVPVGAVVVKDGEVISVGRNRREADKNALAHAELEAIGAACRALGGWRLWQCELYVTLEPCPMCTGAIINSRLRRVVYGASDRKSGSCGSVVNLFELPYNHSPEVVSGFMEEECGKLLTDFFRGLRNKRKDGNI